MKHEEIYQLLESQLQKYNQLSFIVDDPISIPHLFTKKQDIEITGLWASVLAWGQRKTIINKCKELIRYMDNAPFDFICNHTENDLKPFLAFKHRTFNADDTLYFIEFFRDYYSTNESLETAFSQFLFPEDSDTKKALIGFRKLFFSLPAFPARTVKHISSPESNAACKRLNMFLRWMVRKDKNGVDFGLWNTIKTSQLVCPCDVHVDRVARKLGLISRKQTDWQTATELTQNLKKFDDEDPVKYDFALFGLGLEKF